jgi:hypothetical protein
MSNSSPESSQKLLWYQHIWLALPFALAAVGGAIGGVVLYCVIATVIVLLFVK